MDNTTFRDSLKVKDFSFENKLRNKCDKLRNNSRYKNFTNRFILTVGSEIEENFSGVDFDFKARYKSNSSANKKIEKMARLHSENLKEHLGMPDSHFKIYDTIGAKIVPFRIDENFHSEHICIDGYLSRRAKASQVLQKSIKDFETFKANNSDLGNYDMICSVKQEVIDAHRDSYNLCEYICQNKIAESIYSFIKDDELLKKEFGLYIADNRDKDFNTAEEYIAKHITFGSTILPDWFIELQFKSNIDYIAARNGPSAHFNRSGKERIVPENFDKIDLNCIPTYIVYKSQNELYEAGNFENIYHYYQDQLNEKSLQNLIQSSYGNDHGKYLRFNDEDIEITNINFER